MGLFGRKKKNTDQVTIADLDMNEILGNRENVNDKLFDTVSRAQYVNTQCEQIMESSKYIDDAKAEYNNVISHLNDIQIIESLPKNQRKLLADTAEDVVMLTNERVKNRNKKVKIRSAKYNYYLSHEDELEQSLKKLQGDEQYFQIVRKDLNLLESEKLALREDIDKYTLAQGNIRNISIIGIITFVAIMVILLATGVVGPKGDNYILTVFLFLVTAFVVLMTILLRNAVYTVKMSEKKLNRAIVLQNKIKIKYINIVNSIEYQYAKYGVSNSYEFSEAYQVFLEEKKEREQYAKITGMLGQACNQLNNMLEDMGLSDPAVWNNQVEALYQPEEMNVIRGSLNEQRKKLREQIDYNLKRIDEAKGNVKAYIKKNPEHAKEIMDIVNGFEIINGGE